MMPESVGGPLKQVQSAIDGPDPDLVIHILTEGLDAIIRKTSRVGGLVAEMHELPRSIHPVQPRILRTHPQGSLAVPQQAQHQVTRKAAGIIGIMPEMHEFIGLPVDRKSTRLNSSHQIISYA